MFVRSEKGSFVTFRIFVSALISCSVSRIPIYWSMVKPFSNDDVINFQFVKLTISAYFHNYIYIVYSLVAKLPSKHTKLIYHLYEQQFVRRHI